MSSGARVVTSIGAQTASGTPPTVWQYLRVTNATTMKKPNMVASEEVTPIRLSAGQQVVSVDVTGDISQELSYGTSDLLFASAFFNNWVTGTAGASVTTGSITGTTLTVTAVTSGSITVGQTLVGTGITLGTTVLAVLTGTGGIGTYTVSTSQTASSTTVTGSSPASDTLTLGNTAQFFSVARDFTDIGVYNVVRDCIASKLVLTIPTSGKNTIVTTVAGLSSDDSKVSSFATSPTPVTTTEFMSSINMGTIQINGAPLGACISALSLTIDNLVNVQRCLGKGLVAGAQISGGATVTGSMTLAWSAVAYDLWLTTFSRAAMSVSFPISDAAGNQYLITLPQVEVMGDFPSAPKTAIVEIPLNFSVVRQAPTITRTAAV